MAGHIKGEDFNQALTDVAFGQHPLPVRYMRFLKFSFPEIWSLAEEFRDREKKWYPDKPKWAYLTSNFGLSFKDLYEEAINKSITGMDPNREQKTVSVLKDMLYKLGPSIVLWRLGQGIYKFDDTLVSELQSMDADSKLPVEVFFQLPEWCLYFDLSNVKFEHAEHVQGAFVSLGWFIADKEKRKTETFLDIRIVKDWRDGQAWYFHPLQMIIHLNEDDTVQKAIDAVFKSPDRLTKLSADVKDKLRVDSLEIVNLVVNMAIYICCTNTDIKGRNKTDKPAKPKPVKTATGVKLFPATNPTIWEVGYRVGHIIRLGREAARKYVPREDGTVRQRPMPHLRKAHYHHYWIGKRNGPDRKLIVKLLHPMLINCDDDPENLTPTVYPVE